MPNDDSTYDAAAAADILARALALVGGPELVVGSLGSLPGAVRTAERSP